MSFIDLIIDYALWIKAAHVVSVIAWMAGLFYLPRLFVYHAEATSPEVRATFKVMERKLYKVIMQPAMHLSLLFGIILAMIPDTWSQPWFHMKCTAVVALIAFHFFLNTYRIEFENDASVRTSRFFRIINEIPTVLLIIIVVAVIVKPF